MGAKTWMLISCKGNPREILKSQPALDRDATVALAKKLFPSEKLQACEDGDLSFTCPPDDELVIGAFPDLTIVAVKEFGIDFPSKLPAHFLNAGAGQWTCLHAMHSAVDWFAYAIWQDGVLVRSLSLSPDSGIMEDLGARLPFEEAYWAGQHPALDPDEEDEEEKYPFAFHPLELGEAALLEFFGYQLEGMMDPSHLEPENVGLMRFKRKKSWWKF